MVFAFQVLTTIIFVSAFFAVMYHLGVMQFIIRQIAKVIATFAIRALIPVVGRRPSCRCHSPDSWLLSPAAAG